jgi:hypothetical protein
VIFVEPTQVNVYVSDVAPVFFTPKASAYAVLARRLDAVLSSGVTET